MGGSTGHASRACCQVNQRQGGVGGGNGRAGQGVARIPSPHCPHSCALLALVPTTCPTPHVASAGRTGKQCRERWCNNLDPSLKKGAWTAEEDQIILKMHAKLGTRWAEIAKSLPGRSDNSVKNRWYSTCSRVLRQQQESTAEGSDGHDKGGEGRGALEASRDHAMSAISRVPSDHESVDTEGTEALQPPQKRTRRSPPPHPTPPTPLSIGLPSPDRPLICPGSDLLAPPLDPPPATRRRLHSRDAPTATARSPAPLVPATAPWPLEIASPPPAPLVFAVCGRPQPPAPGRHRRVSSYPPASASARRPLRLRRRRSARRPLAVGPMI